MEQDLLLRISNIEKQQAEVIKLEPLRQQKIREGITRLLEENVGKENYDGNRLEQELIYYIEKIDITEEQVRLKNHCDYFKALLAEKEEAKASKTIKSILGSLTTVVQGLSELRNQYGSGHGKKISFRGLTSRHAKLSVGAASNLRRSLCQLILIILLFLYGAL